MIHQPHIKAGFLATALLLFSWVFMLPQAAGQHEVSIGQQAGCPGNEVMVPVEVGKFNDVSAFTFYIGVDLSTVYFVSVENMHEALSHGNLESHLNISTQVITITWYAMSPASISSGKLFDLNMEFNQSPSFLSFSEDCEIALSDLSVVENAIFNNGILSEYSTVPVDPPSNTINAGGTANFLLPFIPDVAYQWQKFEDGNWTSLYEDTFFTGVLTNNLSIVSVPYDFNNSLYRCLITGEDCSGTTPEAILYVNAVGIDEQEGRGHSLLHVFPNPAGEQLTVTPGTTIHDGTVYLTDICGRIVIRENIANLQSGSQHTLNLGNVHNGFYVLQLFSENKFLASVKIARKL